MVAHLTFEFKRITNRNFAAKINAYCQIAEATLEDYLYRVIPIDSSKSVVTSIRFKGGDLSKPFVEIVAKNFIVSDSIEWLKIAHQIGPLYSIFNPQYIRFFDGIETIPNETCECTFDQWYIAGPLATLKEKGPPNAILKPTFKVTNNLNFYKNYQKAFKQLEDAAHGNEIMIQLESKATLQKLILEKQLIEVFVGNEWAGFIAVKKEDYLYFKGYVVYEEILLDKFKRKGLGKTLQRAMIDHLPATNTNLLYGTIDHQNTASIKTALANGRHKVGKYVFCKIK